jgi:hypothetical protein
MTRMTISKELLDELLSGLERPEDLLRHVYVFVRKFQVSQKLRHRR